MLPRENTILIVVDIQGNLYRAMEGKETLLDNNLRLIKGAVSLELPIIVSEQNKIGATIPEIMEAVPDCRPIMKASFSCCGEEQFMKALTSLAPKQIILSGIEAHVCVYQTALDLINLGYRIYLTADAIASRNSRNKDIAIRRLTSAGAVLTSTEMVLFELLRTSTDPKARDIFGIVK